MTYNGYAYPIINTETFSKSHDRYLTITSQKYAPPPPPIPAASGSSSGIEDILEQDSQALLDQVVTTAFSIVYRLKIYNDINTKLDYSWAKTKSQLFQLYDWIPGTNMNVERRRSMLQKELNGIDRQILEEKINCWKDLTQPTNYFVSLFHKHKELKQDRKLLQ